MRGNNMSDETQTKKETNVADQAGCSGSPSLCFVGFLLTATYLILLSILLVVAIVQFWPSPGTPQGPAYSLSQTRFLLWTVSLSNEARLLLIVVFAGALGGQVRSMRSIAWYVGNKKLEKSWLLQYVMAPFIGAILAIIAYLVIRGAFFPANISAQQTSIYGFAGLASLVGIASDPIALKLKDVADTLFTKPIQGKHSKPQQ